MQSPDSRLDQDHYKVLGVEYDATIDSIRTSYLRLALKWHPDKHNDASAATLKFQEINEAYRVLSDPFMRHEYDMRGNYGLQDYNYTPSRPVIVIRESMLDSGFEDECFTVKEIVSRTYTLRTSICSQLCCIGQR
uniref:J domain-containing protein n=1 Tax=Physcomitrium patens TaxID=3218 RepID=A0A7I4AKC3_PHYPA